MRLLGSVSLLLCISGDVLPATSLAFEAAQPQEDE